MRFRTALSRAFRLRCPECGESDISDGLLSTKPACERCKADLAVESGYFLGAIYFNYGATVLIVLSAAIPLVFVADWPTLPIVVASTLFCVVFPLWFFRYARSLWLAMDHYYHERRRSATLANGDPAAMALATTATTTATVTRTRRQASNADDQDVQMTCLCPLCYERFDAPAAFANTWSQCPECFGDVLLLPIANHATHTVRN